MKRFALNDEYKVLYDKVVPPISVMQESNKDLSKTVAQLMEVVSQYDQNLCTKANKQELLVVDNKFR